MPSDSLLDALRKLVTNELPTAIPPKTSFIVGLNPSSGARSPKLWNAAYDEFGIDGRMFPLDVSEENLASLISLLESDQRVNGVAVAVPYKSNVAELLHPRLTAAAARCGSVNLLSRDSDGRLSGCNTDGLAAVESLREVRPNLAKSRVLILGCGGTGRSIVSELLNEIGSNQIIVAIRSDTGSFWLTNLGIATTRFDVDESELERFDIVVNCTTVGWGNSSDSSPMQQHRIQHLNPDCLVFDVVYQPDPTVFLRLAAEQNLSTLSGSRMNLLQAAFGFCLVNSDANLPLVAETMREATSK